MLAIFKLISYYFYDTTSVGWGHIGGKVIFFTLNKIVKLCRCFLGIHNDQGIFTPRGIFCNGFKSGFAHVFIFAFLEILKIGSVGNKLIIVHIRQELIKKLRIIGHCGGEKKGFAVKILCYIAHSFKAGAKKFCWNKVYFIKNYHAVTEIVELSQC